MIGRGRDGRREAQMEKIKKNQTDTSTRDKMETKGRRENEPRPKGTPPRKITAQTPVGCM